MEGVSPEAEGRGTLMEPGCPGRFHTPVSEHLSPCATTTEPSGAWLSGAGEKLNPLWVCILPPMEGRLSDLEPSFSRPGRPRT